MIISSTAPESNTANLICAGDSQLSIALNTIQELEQKITSFQRSSKILAEANDLGSKAIKQLEEKIKSLEEENNELLVDLQDTVEQCEQQSNQIIYLQDQNHMLEKEKSDLLEELCNMNDDQQIVIEVKDRIQQVHTSYQRQISAVVAEGDAKDAELDHLKSSLQSARESLGQALQENTTLLTRISLFDKLAKKCSTCSAGYLDIKAAQPSSACFDQRARRRMTFQMPTTFELQRKASDTDSISETKPRYRMRRNTMNTANDSRYYTPQGAESEEPSDAKSKMPVKGLRRLSLLNTVPSDTLELGRRRTPAVEAVPTDLKTTNIERKGLPETDDDPASLGLSTPMAFAFLPLENENEVLDKSMTIKNIVVSESPLDVSLEPSLGGTQSFTSKEDGHCRNPAAQELPDECLNKSDDASVTAMSVSSDSLTCYKSPNFFQRVRMRHQSVLPRRDSRS